MVLDHGKFRKDSRDKGGSTLENFDSLMGAKNTRASQSPLHSEIEALGQWNVWKIYQFNVTFATNCSQLVNMVSESKE